MADLYYNELIKNQFENKIIVENVVIKQSGHMPWNPIDMEPSYDKGNPEELKKIVLSFI